MILKTISKFPQHYHPYLHSQYPFLCDWFHIPLHRSIGSPFKPRGKSIGLSAPTPLSPLSSGFIGKVSLILPPSACSYPFPPCLLRKCFFNNNPTLPLSISSSLNGLFPLRNQRKATKRNPLYFKSLLPFRARLLFLKNLYSLASHILFNPLQSDFCP